MPLCSFKEGPAGRQRMAISPDYLCNLLELNLSAPCIAKLMGISRSTVYRRMAEYNLSIKALYSTMTDEELDQCVREIKSRQPYSGYRMVKALLQARGLRLQYNRVRASMHLPYAPFRMHCSTDLLSSRTPVFNSY